MKAAAPQPSPPLPKAAAAPLTPVLLETPPVEELDEEKTKQRNAEMTESLAERVLRPARPKASINTGYADLVGAARNQADTSSADVGASSGAAKESGAASSPGHHQTFTRVVRSSVHAEPTQSLQFKFANELVRDEEEEDERDSAVQRKLDSSLAGEAPVPPDDEEERLQRKDTGAGPSGAAATPSEIHAIARAGVENASEPLPHLDRIQPLLAPYDLSGVRTVTGGGAAEANAKLGALGYTMGERIAFRSAPDVKLAAHEAAHVVQQRDGPSLCNGLGQAGDCLELQADEFANAIATEQIGGNRALPRENTETNRGASEHNRRTPAQQSESGREALQLAPDPTPATSSPSSTPTSDTANGSGALVPGGPPVLFGLDISTDKPTVYFSVTHPGRRLVDIALYIYGSEDAAEALGATNGTPGPEIPAGRALRPIPDRAMAATVVTAINTAIGNGSILRSRGVTSQGQTPQNLYHVVAQGQTLDVTDEQLDALALGVSVWIGRRARYYSDRAQNGIDVERDFLNSTNSVVRGISDWMGNADRPSPERWMAAKARADALANKQSKGSRDTVGPDALDLASIEREVVQLEHEWHAYIDATISGAQSVQTGLEVTRDVSFGIAAGIAGAIAAPVVFGAGVAALGTVGVTGTAATVIATGGAVVGGGIAGAGVHGGLELGSSATGEGLAALTTPGGKFDAGYVLDRTKAGLTSGFEEGALGAASYFASAGLAARFGLGFATSRPGRAAIGAAVGGGAGLVASSLDVLEHPERGPAGQRILGGTLMGMGAGALFSQLPITGLYKTGGSPWNPFSGTPVTPPWMIASPWATVQPGSNTHPLLNSLPPEALGELPPGYSMTRVNGNQWAIVKPPNAPDIEINAVGPDQNGAWVVSFRAPDPGNPSRMIYTYSHPRPLDNTYSGNRVNLPNYHDPNGVAYDSSHAQAHADTPDPTQVGRNTTSDPAFRSPAGVPYNQTFRRTLEGRIRAGGPWPNQGAGQPGEFIEVQVYDDAVPPVRDVGTATQVGTGERIPTRIWFIRVQNGQAVDAWEFPVNVSRQTGTLNFDADLLQYQRPLSAVPRAVLSQAGLPAAAVAGAGATATVEAGSTKETNP